MNDAQRLQLTLPALEREMGEDAFGVCLYVYDKTASTNLSARQLVMDGFRGEAILAASEHAI